MAGSTLGVIELFREMPREPVVARFRPFDPIYDLSSVAAYALRHALQLEPGNALAANTLKIAYDSRLMHEAAVALLDRIKQSADGPSRVDYGAKWAHGRRQSGETWATSIRS